MIIGGGRIKHNIVVRKRFWRIEKNFPEGRRWCMKQRATPLSLLERERRLEKSESQLIEWKILDDQLYLCCRKD